MKIKFLTYYAASLFIYAILNDVATAECVTVTVYNRGSWWSPYITYTPCMYREERTDDLGWWSDYETFSTQSGKPIKLGPKWTNTVYFEQTPYSNYFNVVCHGVMGSSATCEVARGGKLQTLLEQTKNAPKGEKKPSAQDKETASPQKSLEQTKNAPKGEKKPSAQDKKK